MPAAPRSPRAPAGLGALGASTGLTSPSPQNQMEPKKPMEGTPAGLTNLTAGNPAGLTNPAAGNPAGRRSCIARSVDNRNFEQRTTTKPTAPAQPVKDPARVRRTEAARARLALHRAPTAPNQALPDLRQEPTDPHQAPTGLSQAPTEPNVTPTDRHRGLAARSLPVPDGTEAAPGGRRIAPKTARSQSPLAPKQTSAARRQIRIAVSQARKRDVPSLAPSRPTASRRHSGRNRCLRGLGPRPGRFALRGRKAVRLRQSPRTRTSGAKTLARHRP